MEDLGDDEFDYWETINELNPIGRWKNDFHHAQLCATIGNWSGYAKETISPKDYMWAEEEEKPPTQDELRNKFMKWVAAHNSKQERQDGRSSINQS